MDPGTLYAVVAITNVISQIISQVNQRLNGSFADQQRLLADIRGAEAVRAEERARTRSQYESELRLAEADAALNRQKNLAEFHSRLQVWTQAELAALKRGVENSPFREDPEVVHQRASDMCAGGRLPLLLIAPMRHEDHGARNGPDAPAFATARRRQWLDLPWHDDMALGDGLIVRPLIYTDVDVHIIKQVLWDLPVVLLHGDVQSRTRVLPELTAWNLAPHQQRPFHLPLAPMTLPYAVPTEPAESEQRRLVFEDHLARTCAWMAGALAEWFHTTRWGRVPGLHLCIDEHTPEQQGAASYGAQLLALAAADETLDPAIAVVYQAAVLAEGGLPAEAEQTVANALPLVQDAATTYVGSRGQNLTEALKRLRKALATQPVAQGDLQQLVANLITTSIVTWMVGRTLPAS